MNDVETSEFRPNEPTSEALDKVILAFKTQRPKFESSGIVGILIGNDPSEPDYASGYIVSRFNSNIGYLELCFMKEVLDMWIKKCYPEGG